MKTIRTAVAAAILLSTLSVSAVTLNVEVTRNGFTSPIEIAVAPRVEGRLPEWSATKTLAAGKSAVSFPDIAEGLYIVLASGPGPLQRLSAKANVGSAGSTVRLAIPETTTSVKVTLAGEPLPRAGIAFNHEELRWRMDVETDAEGRFAGSLWEPGAYSASVTRDRSAPHFADVTLSPATLVIDVPDRHVRGRVIAAGGKPVAGAEVTLRSETARSTLTMSATSGPDGRFEFLGVRDAAHTLSARAPSYLHSDAARFELRGAPARHSADLVLTQGEPRPVRVVDARDAAIAGATLLTSCGGHVKSMAVTNAEGRADVALPPASSCTVYAFPTEGSLAAGRFEGASPLLIRVPDGSSSLHLALKSGTEGAFAGLRMLMRIDGTILPPEIARLLGNRGFPLITADDGTISLPRIPPGTYEFWPYRTTAEGQMIYEVSGEIQAPISVRVSEGENNTTVRFKAR